MVLARTSKLALKNAVWAVNWSMKAHIFFHGQSKNDFYFLLEDKKINIFNKILRKGFVDSSNSNEGQIFNNLFSLHLKQHTELTIK